MIIRSFIPAHIEFFSCLTISKPMVPHIPGLRSLSVNVVVCESCCGGVISLNRSWRLWVTKLFEHMSNWNGRLGIKKDSCCFRFCCRSYNMLKRLTKNQCRTICVWMIYALWVVVELEVTCYPTFCIWHHQVGSITVNQEHHVTRIISHIWIGICCSAIEYLLAFFFSIVCWFGLGAGYFVKGRKHWIIKCSGVIKKSSCNGLDAFYLLSGKKIALIVTDHLLRTLFAAYDGGVLMRRMLREYFLLIIKFLQCCWNCFWHRCICISKFIVPV